MSEHARNGHTFCLWIALLMALIAVAVPLIKSAEASLSAGSLAGKYSFKFGLFEICTNVDDGDDTCGDYPDGADLLGGNVYTMQSLYVTAVVCLFMGVGLETAATIMHRSTSKMKEKTVIAGYASALFSFLGGIFFLAVGIYMVQMINGGLHTIDVFSNTVDRFGARTGTTAVTIEVDDGWNYTFIYAWIGWIQCWQAAGTSVVLARSVPKGEGELGHTHHRDHHGDVVNHNVRPGETTDVITSAV